MEQFTQRQLRAMVSDGSAVDVTSAGNRRDIPEQYTQIGYAAGLYGCNGMLLKGDGTGKLYAVTARTSAVYIF